jgi:hypothetical protein
MKRCLVSVGPSSRFQPAPTLPPPGRRFRILLVFRVKSAHCFQSPQMLTPGSISSKPLFTTEKRETTACKFQRDFWKSLSSERNFLNHSWVRTHLDVENGTPKPKNRVVGKSLHHNDVKNAKRGWCAIGHRFLISLWFGLAPTTGFVCNWARDIDQCRKGRDEREERHHDGAICRFAVERNTGFAIQVYIFFANQVRSPCVSVGRAVCKQRDGVCRLVARGLATAMLWVLWPDVDQKKVET